jgi:site-specific recombinase XerD
VRTTFVAAARRAGLPAAATCPKSWRHTFATLLQEANVDLLVRQETLGHKPASADASALGMTGIYTHTSPELQKREVERALRLRPKSLSLATTPFTDGVSRKETGHVAQ